MPVIEKHKVDKQSDLYKMRHSLAHVMAQAVQRLFPGVKLGFGPPIDDGFYYDFLFPAGTVLTDADLATIQKEMQKIVKEDQPFQQEELSFADAIARLTQMGEPHKVEYCKELHDKKGFDTIGFYTNGPFVDMCEGPHVENVRQLKPDQFKLHALAGAYWRGDERNVQLTRIYAYAFPSKPELKEHIQNVEQAKKNDHRILGQKLSIYSIAEEVGKGLPLWLPNGAAIRHELEKLAYEMEFAAGYVKVATPIITREGLYHTSGHLPLYAKGMYPPMEIHEEAEGDEQAKIERYYIKPMNCPHHHMVFKAEKRSYRDLPLRLCEYGYNHRFERAGTLQGLTRVRGFCMNDAHIYVTPEQLKDEFKAVLELHRKYYALFEFNDYYLRLSKWDPDDPKKGDKYVDDPAGWAFSERIVQEALEEMNLEYTIEPGEAAFYGPKVDYEFRTVTGREFTATTNQLDFCVPARFELEYTDKDGEQKTPYCIHRAPLGTHERFIAILIEHYGGAFPTWLAPIQVCIVPVSEKHLDYAKKVESLLRSDLVRTELDDSNNTMGKKIRTNTTRKIPILLILGDQEEADATVTIRRYGIEQQDTMPLDTFHTLVREEIRARKHVKG
ncbi:MAG: threonine--tRNA ligase [Phycisphaerales bacterium]|nr:threonine--tRNA ligase [Phycisphaerales bacterium]